MSLLGNRATSAFMRNRSIQVKVVKDQDSSGEIIDADPNRNPMEGVEVAAAYAEIAKDFITHTALVIGGTFAVCQIIKKVCK